MTTVAPAPDDLADLEPVLDDIGELKTAHDRLMAIMSEIQFLRKSEEFKKQSGAVQYRFRGVDAVMKAVGPLVRKYGILPKPIVQSITQTNYVTGGGTQMCLSVVRVIYRLKGPGGVDDFEEVEVYGEASDAGDKGVTKALSVAYRTMWLQLLCIPTDEPDPDLHNAERADVKTEQRVQHQRQQATAPRDVHADLLSVVEQVRVLRGEDEETSNGRVAKYCRERLGTDVVTKAVEGGPIEEIDIRRLTVQNAAIMRNAINRSIREIEESRMATKQEV
jgi:hypothetical protein